MKSIQNLLTSILLLFIAVLPSCTEDPSPSPTDPRTAYVGTWLVNETETKGTFEVTIAIDASSSTAVKIYNFANSGATSNPAIAEVSSTNITLVPDQVIGDGWEINGGGALAGSTKINWTYTLKYEGTIHYLSAVYTKQQ